MLETETDMNILEMKGAFMGMLAQIEDEDLLRRMLDNCIEMVKQADQLDDLPAEVLQALEIADLDEDINDAIPNDAVFQQFKVWQKQ